MSNNEVDQLGLQMHESTIVAVDGNEGIVSALRVPGGWIYTTYAPPSGAIFRQSGLIESSVFIPDPEQK